MDDGLIDIVQAVVDELNGQQWRLGFEAVRAPSVPVYDHDDLETLCVTVVPSAFAAETLDRGHDVETVQIDVAIQQRIESDALAVADPLVVLAEDIGRYFRRGQLPVLGANCTQVQFRVLADSEHLRERRTLSNLLTLTFEYSRTIAVA
jgi:hypothetical protein